MPEIAKAAAISVIVADSNPLMLGALAACFDRDKRFSLVATTRSAEGFLDAMAKVPVAVGVIDWGLSGLGAERLLDILREAPGAPRVVVYGEGDERELARHAMAAGAAGCCSRHEPPEVLLEIVADVARGRMVFPFVDVRQLKQDPAATLTAKERDLLAALAQGATNKELAAQFAISVNTVKFHLRNLFDKLGLKNRGQAIAFYYATQAGRPHGTDPSSGKS